MTRDPIGYEGSEWNLYAYVDANAMRYLDPFGFTEFEIVIGPIGGDGIEQGFAEVIENIPPGSGEHGMHVTDADDASDQIGQLCDDDDDCVSSLDMLSHSDCGGGQIFVGPHRGGTVIGIDWSNTEFIPGIFPADPPLNQPGNQFFGDIPFCDDCRIRVHACWPRRSLLQAIANKSGCKVSASSGGIQPGDEPGELSQPHPIDGRPPEDDIIVVPRR